MRSCSFEKRLRTLEAGRDLRGKRASLPSFPGWLAAELSSEPNLMTQVGISTADNPWQYEALPAQRSFHSDLGSRFKGYSGPVGSGKSHALVYEALFLSRLNPGLLGLIGAPTYPMLRDSTQRTFFEVLQQERIEYTFHKQENKVRFLANGSEVIFRTLENPDRLRGPNLAWFAIDELTYAREDAWTRLLARLRHPAARRLCGCAVWTPNGYDWVHRRFLESKAPDYRVVLATPRENTHLPPDFYDQLQGSYSERFYRQEVLGEYLDMAGGNAYYAFNEKNIQPMEYDPHLPLCWALDFNVDPLCSVICQIEERKDLTAMRVGKRRTIKVLRVLDEIVLPNSNTVEAATEFSPQS
jgi:PBSX family phage terminase large subunit